METRLPPGPKPSRWTGASWSTTWNWLRRPYPFLEELRAEFGDTFSLRLPGLPPLVVFSDPDTVREIFTEDGTALHGGEFNLSLEAFLGRHSVLMTDGAEHLRKRRLLLPPFHGERMQAYGQTMLDVADDVIDAWPLGVPFSVHPHMQTITVRVIVRTILGVDEPERLDAFARQLAELLDLGSWPPLLVPALQRDLGRFSPWGRFLRARAAAERALLAEIAKRRGEGTAGRTDVLSLLVAAKDEQGRPFGDEELKDELVTLLVAGHETSATGLAWALRWVLGDPAVESKLRAALATATLEGSPVAPLSAERIARVELLDATVREALRLVPVVPIVGRVLKRPMRIGGWDLPAGVAVLCSIYSAHRRPEAWPHPERFDPTRFLGRKISPYEFYPFGGGVRRCIGMAFSLYEMKMVLARVLARTRLRLAEPSERIHAVRRSITMMPSGGLRVVASSVSARGPAASRSAAATGPARAGVAAEGRT